VLGASARVHTAQEKLAELDDPRLALRWEQEEEAKAERLAELHARGDRLVQPRPARGVTVLAAAKAVLAASDGPLHYREIAKRAVADHGWAPKGKTPEATMNATLATRAKAGDTFVKTAPGTFDLKERGST
jgi:HB1, ASXL, restriction endonuclease HTH domain